MDFNGRENVFLNGAIQGLPRAEIKRRFDEIVAFAELENAIDRPVRTYSSGMTMRLGFAIAAFLDADILLLDEVFAVGDEAFQRKCFGRIFAFKERGGTIVFVSHDASAVERLCERSVFLEGGQVAFDGPTREAVDPIPTRARGRREPGRARCRASGVGLGRGVDRVCGSRRGTKGLGPPAVPLRRAVRAPGGGRGRRDPAAAAAARAPRRRGDARGGSRGRSAQHRLGRRERPSRRSLPHRCTSARGRPLPSSPRPHGRGRGARVPLARRRARVRRLSGG